jgi:hypothetical protein
LVGASRPRFGRSVEVVPTVDQHLRNSVEVCDPMIQKINNYKPAPLSVREAAVRISLPTFVLRRALAPGREFEKYASEQRQVAA